jgi:RND family efflux transporter MFP subunit
MNSKTKHSRAAAVARLLLGTAMVMVMALPSAARTPAGQEQTQVRALVISDLETTISSEIAARITSIAKKPGERFKKGERLLSLDRTLFSARLKKAQVDLDTARKVLEANQKLMQFKSISELELVTSRADVAQAEAEVRLYSIQLSKCSIAAPFSGRVVSKLVNPHQFVQEGTPLLELVDDRNLSLQMFVPSMWVGSLQEGDLFTVQVDELNTSFPARITTLGARIDSNSRTIEIRAAIQGAHPGLLPGMSGTALLAPTSR